ncbi:AAA family ATPase [Streptomyces sp. CA-294286]|uniref:AAA family ATPase n=1 Tax=Streptomyces sp. CA-294286 TaxID=3240070 RepID=UPI003D8D636E
MSDQSGPSGWSGAVFGRAGEIGVLSARAAAARAGHSGIVVLTGPPGIGKTSLVNAFLPRDDGEAHGPRGMKALRATCAAETGTVPYEGVRALLRPLGLVGESAPGHPLLRGTARRALPALMPGTDRPPFASDADYPVLQGLFGLTAQLTALHPLALVLDDAHLCDAYTLRWLDFLLRRADGLPLLLILARSTDASTADSTPWARFASHPSCTTVHLTPLSPDAVGELTRHAFGRPVEPSFAARVADVSGGNPGSAVRLLAELRSAGVRPDLDGARHVTALGARLVARSVRTLFGRSPGWVEPVATALAILGEELLDNVAALAGVSVVQVEDALCVLRDAEVLAPGRNVFTSDDVRTAILEPLDAAALAGLRARAALLLSDAGRPAEDIAAHLLATSVPPEPWMLSLLTDAAATAEDRGAPTDAVCYLRRVLEATPEDHELRIRLAGLVARTDPGAALDLLHDALDRAPDLRTRAAAALRYTTTCLAAGQSVPHGRAPTQVLAELRAATGLQEPALALESALLLTGAAERGNTPGPPGPDRPPAPRPADAEADAEAVSALVATLYDTERATATTHARRAVEAAGSRASWPVLTSCTVLALAGESDEALTVLNDALAPTGEPRTRWADALALSARALVLHGTGAITEAKDDARAALAAADEAPQLAAADGAPQRLLLPRLVLAAALSDSGEATGAEDLLTGIEPQPTTGPVVEQHLHLMVRARVRRALGDREGALHLLLACGRAQREAGLANPVFAPWWAEACWTLAALDRPQDARGHAEYGSELARRWGTAQALGTAALARGVITPGKEGLDLLGEAVDTLAASPARAVQARASFALGRRLLTRGDRAKARPHLRSAVDLALTCGALPLALGARRLLITAGGRMPELTGSREDLLTGAERRVVELVLNGASNREAAQSLCVTLRTVETHLTSAYRKLGVQRRAALATTLRAPAARARASGG